jgi:hypothetical protein
VHGDQVALADDQVQLTQAEVRMASTAAAGDLVRDQHLLVAVGVDLRPLAALAQVLQGQLVQADSIAQHGEVVRVGIGEIQPGQAAIAFRPQQIVL